MTQSALSCSVKKLSVATGGFFIGCQNLAQSKFQTVWNGEFQERWTVVKGKNRVSGESGRAMKP